MSQTTTNSSNRTSRPREQAAEITETVDESENCQECGGEAQVDEYNQLICQKCGLVLDTDFIDRGPEWRIFDNNNESKIRTGPPIDITRHDNGLTTEIGFDDTDGNGNAFSGAKRRKLGRLRKQQSQTKIADKKERNQVHALSNIKRISSNLELPRYVRKDAALIFKNVHEQGLVGYTLEAMTVASVYAAVRQHEMPITLHDLTEVSRVDKSTIRTHLSVLVQNTDTKVAPQEPITFLPRLASELGINSETERLAKTLLEHTTSENIHIGKNPVGYTGGIIYTATRATEEKLSQQKAADACNISAVTLRERFYDIIENVKEDWFGEYPIPEGQRHD